MQEYFVYPEGEKKLRDAGLADRVAEYSTHEEFPFFGGMVYEDDVRSSVDELRKDFYSTIPDEDRRSYRLSLNKMFKDAEHSWITPDQKNPNSQRDMETSWKISRPEGEVYLPITYDHVQLLSGWHASFILKPEEFWNPERFGFTSPTELLGTLGAYVQSYGKSHLDKRAYHWVSEYKNGSRLTTEVTGDMNADLRLLQRDITPYKTTDPFGNTVLYRPVLNEDHKGVCGYHSTEGNLLASILKYIRQENIESSIFKDKAAALIQQTREQGQHGSSCAEHFGGFDKNPGQFFVSHDCPLPVLDKKLKALQPSFDAVSTTSNAHYFIYVGPEKELCFVYELNDIKRRKQKKNIELAILPQDTDHFIQGLLQQAGAGLGRTSSLQLISILEYYFSEKFEHDQQRWKSLASQYAEK